MFLILDNGSTVSVKEPGGVKTALEALEVAGTITHENKY